MSTSSATYTARPDARRRVLLRPPEGVLYEQYLVRHRADGVIELRPQITVDAAALSKRTLATIERSMAALERGDASPPLDLDEAFPGDDAESAA